MPRQFREGLKAGRPLLTDRNIRVSVDNSTTPNERLTPSSEVEQTLLRPETATASSSSSQLHIVYDSEKKDVIPYPEGEFIRTPSPEHTGIPAVRVLPPPARGTKTQQPEEYTSDESTAHATRHHHRKYPPTRRRSKNGRAEII